MNGVSVAFASQVVYANDQTKTWVDHHDRCQLPFCRLYQLDRCGYSEKKGAI